MLIAWLQKDGGPPEMKGIPNAADAANTTVAMLSSMCLLLGRADGPDGAISPSNADGMTEGAEGQRPRVLCLRRFIRTRSQSR